MAIFRRTAPIASVGQQLLDTTSTMIVKKVFEKFAEAAVE